MNPAIIKPAIDWQAIERDYRAGVLSYTEIGALHGVSKGRISLVEKKVELMRKLGQKRLVLHLQKKLDAVPASLDLALEMPGQFDAVSCLEMLEHVPDPVSVLRACATLLKPGARLFLSTLNRTPKAFALGIVGAEYVLGLLPRGTHRYERFLKPSELRRALRDLGFDDIEFEGLKYDPFSHHVERNQDLSVNYLVAAVRSC